LDAGILPRGIGRRQATRRERQAFGWALR
jgi:hypothetical protein